MPCALNETADTSSHLAMLQHSASSSGMLRIPGAVSGFCCILLFFVLSSLLHVPRFTVLLQILCGLLVLCVNAGFSVGSNSADSRNVAAAMPRRPAIRLAGPLRGEDGSGRRGGAAGRLRDQVQQGGNERGDHHQYHVIKEQMAGEGEDDLRELHRRADAFIHRIRMSFKKDAETDDVPGGPA